MSKTKHSGFAHIEIIVIAVIVVAVVGFIAWRMSGAEQNPASQGAQTPGTPLEEEAATTAPSAELIWQQAENGWRSTQAPPACPTQPMMHMPADVSKVTSVLYPGQTRGGNYKPHGGFRFDGTANNKVTVTAPVEGFIVRGGSYLSEGEVQYTFDIMHNCGVMYRLGHFRELPDHLKKIADTWPTPQEGDSRTQLVHPAVYVKQGEVLATSVGIVNGQNSFFDWGVYDYRQPNQSSQSTTYQQAHMQDKELSWHAVCWFSWLPTADSQKLMALPAGDPASGKNSDYCK